MHIASHAMPDESGQMAHRILRDVEADGWERSDFPIICESCLGDNPYIRMTKANYDKECKICTRPFTVFRWRPDLEYGLPVQVRDTALSINSNDSIPKSDVNRDYFAEEHDLRARAGLDYESSYGKERPNDTILKLQRTTPYYKRNRAHICSFFIRGECTRGAECPYRHEMPETGELSQQNIKDRYYGVNDPVALKLLNKAGEMPSLEPPEDESIRTLYIGGLDARVTEQDLRDNFYTHGEIESVKIIPQRACAFITYTTREGAENAANELSNKLVIKGLRLKLMWGRPQAPKLDGGEAGPNEVGMWIMPGWYPVRLYRRYNRPVRTTKCHRRRCIISDHHGRAFYPPMDPQRMGAVIRSQDGSGGSGSGENVSHASSGGGPQYAAYPPPPPPPQGGGGGRYYQQYYPPPPVPGPYQQYPPQSLPSAMPPPGQGGAPAASGGPPPQQ
ncbi:unnamed protein product [Lactuca saligna]|uniref:Uncharacterized protein n=1 Tax=Lactuca saligna TaxID=75948 RepID=A0AA36A4J2_LACSI|nr:unnamed protein product [Lactuca saligna]